MPEGEKVSRRGKISGGRWDPARVLALAALLALVLSPVVRADSGPIIYKPMETTPGENPGVWLANSDGSSRRFLYRAADDEWSRTGQGVLTPDGQTAIVERWGPLPHGKSLHAVAVGSNSPGPASTGLVVEPLDEPEQAVVDPAQRSVYFAMADWQGGSGIYRTPLSGLGPTEQVQHASQAIRSFSIDRNGARVAYTTGATLQVADSPTGTPRKLNLGSSLPRGNSGAAAISPDGTRIVFAAYPTSGGLTDMYSIGFDGTGLKRLTNTVTTDEKDFSWSPDGTSILYTSAQHRPTEDYNVRKMQSDGTADALVIQRASAAHYRPPSTLDDTDLLNRYAPRLRYAESENSKVQGAASILENYNPDRSPPLDANVLCSNRTQCVSPLASADPNSEHRLSLDFLRSDEYETGSAVFDTDFIDEVGDDDDKISDGQRQFATYKNQIYGRVVPSGTKRWLQYWLFSYYDTVPGGAGEGAHEGDWEMVQVRLDTNGIPERATFARHDNGEAASCPWSSLQKEIAIGNRTVPTVFVASGTHASYFAPAVYDRPGPLPSDNATGDGDVEDTEISQVLTGLGSSADPPWAGWPGSWGSTVPQEVQPPLPPADQSSPRGPLFQGIKTTDPEAFDRQAKPCDAPGFPIGAAASTRGTTNRGTAPRQRSAAATRGTRVRNATPIPTVRVVRTRQGVKIHYSFPAAAVRSPYVLITTRSSRKGSQTRSIRRRTLSQPGEVLLKRNGGRTLRVSVAGMTADYTIGRARRVTVRP